MHKVAPKPFSSGSLRPFSFRRVTSFSPWLLAQSSEPFGEFKRGIRGTIKGVTVDIPFGRERARTEKGLRTCGKRPVVSGSFKSDYDVR